MAASAEDKLPEEEVIGQMTYVTRYSQSYSFSSPSRTFIFAGMDTTSNALSMTLVLLAEHPEIQQKLRDEILEASDGGDLDYDQLVSLPYLDAVCREVLRL